MMTTPAQVETLARLSLAVRLAGHVWNRFPAIALLSHCSIASALPFTRGMTTA